MPGDTELDELMSRFGAGERSWELGARLASVLAAAGRTAQVPGILVECRPLALEKLGAEKIAALADSQIGFTGWRLPKALGRSAILVLQDGSKACEVRLGDQLSIDFGGMGAAAGMVHVGWTLRRSSGEMVVTTDTGFDVQMNEDADPEGLRDAVRDAITAFANAVGATVTE